MIKWCLIVILILFILYYNYNNTEDFQNNINNINNSRNVYLYWTGKTYKLIDILRKLIYYHSNNGKGYNVHMITDKNVKKYIKIPPFFKDLLPAHQADYVRVNVIYKYGGIWLDSDTLVLDSLDSLFDLIKEKNGFFITEKKNLCNAVFGSKKNTKFMKEWKMGIDKILNSKENKISWTEIGGKFITKLYRKHPHLFTNYKIFNGYKTMYPVNWNIGKRDYIDKSYNNYKKYVRKYQPLLILTNSVYKSLEYESKEEIMNGNKPINYFINKSLEIHHKNKSIIKN